MTHKICLTHTIIAKFNLNIFKVRVVPKSVKFDKSVKIKQKLTSMAASFKFNQSSFAPDLATSKSP